MLGDPDRDLRREAAVALGRLGKEEAIRPLMAALLEETNVGVRNAEVSALYKIKYA